jgi:hypothetical protein
VALLVGGLLAVPPGCSDPRPAASPDASPATDGGADGPGADGSGGELCQPSEFPACGQTLTVRVPARLEETLAMAGEGDCVMLAGGDYPTVNVPPGVSLLGASGPADDPHARITDLQLSSGAAVGCATVISAHVADNAGGARLDRVRIKGTTIGVSVGLGGSITLVESQIIDATVAGVMGDEAAAVTLLRSTISGGAGPGVRMSCVAACDQGGGAKLIVDKSTVDGTGGAGLEVTGRVAVTLTGSTVSGTQRIDGAGGQGVVLERGGAQAGGSIVMTDSTLENNAGAGLWASEATQVGLGGQNMMGMPLPATVRGNGFGVVVRGTANANFNAYLQNVEIDGNRGIGLAFDGMGYSYLQMSQIRNPSKVEVPGADGGTVEAGDGMLWTGQSYVQFYGVTFGGNERLSILIDGAVGQGSSADSLTFEDGDQGVQIQNLPQGGATPTFNGSVPMAARPTSETLYPLPSLER